MSSIFFAVILSVLTSSLKTGIFDHLVDNLVSYYSGYVQIHKNGYWEEQTLDHVFERSHQQELEISKNKQVCYLSPRLESFALASAGVNTKGCMVIGVDPEKEHAITQLKDRLIQGEYITSTSAGVLLSEGLAKRLALQVGDTVMLIGQGYQGAMAAGKYPIKGLVSIGAPDLNNQTIYMSLATAQELYGAENMLTSYVIALHALGDLKKADHTLQQLLGPAFEVMTWEEMMPAIKGHIQADSRNMQVVQYILYMLICFGVFGTLLMMMAERQYELGMLVAIGMKKIKLAIAMVYELMLTMLLGCLLGVLCSIPVVYYFHKNPIRIGGSAAKAYERFGFEAIFPTSIHPAHFYQQGLTVFLLALILSFYPAIRLLRMNPVKAMRK